jgi:hypothetical protein
LTKRTCTPPFASGWAWRATRTPSARGANELIALIDSGELARLLA